MSKPSRNGVPQPQPSSLADRDKHADAVLFSKYDDLTTLWKEAEKRLKKLRPPHGVWVSYNDSDPEVHYTWEGLGLDKHNGELRLLHTFNEEGNGREPIVIECLPVSDCPAYIRVDATRHLQRLYERIIEAKEKFIPKVDEAMEQIAKLCEKL